MRNILLVLLFCIVGYQGYSQKNSLTIAEFYPPDTFDWTEEQIIDILDKGDILFCKIDLFLEKNDTMFYVKNMEIVCKDSIFVAAYLESSIFYDEDKKDQQKMNCDYVIINDRFGNQLELTPDALLCLPKLSKYLSVKVKNTHLKECKEGYIFLD